MAKTVRRVKRKTGRRTCRKYSRCKTKKRVKRKYNQKRKRSYKKRSRERIIQEGGMRRFRKVHPEPKPESESAIETSPLSSQRSTQSTPEKSSPSCWSCFRRDRGKAYLESEPEPEPTISSTEQEVTQQQTDEVHEEDERRLRTLIVRGQPLPDDAKLETSGQSRGMNSKQIPGRAMNIPIHEEMKFNIKHDGENNYHFEFDGVTSNPVESRVIVNALDSRGSGKNPLKITFSIRPLQHYYFYEFKLKSKQIISKWKSEWKEIVDGDEETTALAHPASLEPEPESREADNSRRPPRPPTFKPTNSLDPLSGKSRGNELIVSGPSSGLTQSPTAQKTRASLELTADDLVTSTGKTNPGPDGNFRRFVTNLKIGAKDKRGPGWMNFEQLVYNYHMTNRGGNFVYFIDRRQERPYIPAAARPPSALTITNKELKSLNKPGKTVKLKVSNYRGSDIYLTGFSFLQHL